MSFRTILVPIDANGMDNASLQWAAELARRLNARLFGLAAIELVVNVHRGMAPRAATELLEKETRASEARLAELGEAFLAAAGDGAAWRGVIGDAESLLSTHARVADLVLMPPDPGHALPDPGTTILTAGRPVLLLARDLRPLTAETVLVAWKDTKEARRAVADAMPLLQMANHVRVVSVVEGSVASAREGTADVCEYLRHHGVRASAELTEAPDGNIGSAVSRLASETGADLVVSGGYSRGPLRQRIFGGMTSSLLSETGFHRLFSC